MSVKSIKSQLIIDTLEKELQILPEVRDESANLIKEEFPSLSDKEIAKIIDILSESLSRNKEHIELVSTAPNSFKINVKSTRTELEKIIKNATDSITITGYSISEYFDEFLDLIIEQSKKGVLVRMFINNYEKNETIARLNHYKGKFFRIYNYRDEDDKKAALHAKIITVDGKISLISSANLSYHGLEKNIEMGCLVYSSKIAKDIKDLLETLLFQKVFDEVK